MPDKTKYYYAEVYWNAPGKLPNVWRFTSARKRSTALKNLRKSQGKGIFEIKETEKFE